MVLDKSNFIRLHLCQQLPTGANKDIKKETMEDKTVSLQELSNKTGISPRTIRRRLSGKTGQTLLFSGSWKAIDTNPDGVRRQWIFEKVTNTQPQAEAA